MYIYVYICIYTFFFVHFRGRPVDLRVNYLTASCSIFSLRVAVDNHPLGEESVGGSRWLPSLLFITYLLTISKFIRLRPFLAEPRSW